MSLRLFFLFIFCIFNITKIEASVLILTHAYNKPEYIWWQHATLKKFLKDDYTFIVFNDAPNQDLHEKINEVCRNLNITSIDIPQIIHDYRNPYLPAPLGCPRNPLGDPSAECAETIQYMLDTLGFAHKGITVILDSDMFPIREISIEKMMKGYEIAAHPQYREGEKERICYFLPNLLFFNLKILKDKELLNFNVGIIDNVHVDTGGCTHFYIKEHPNLKWLKTDCLYHLRHAPKKLRHLFKGYPKMYRLMTKQLYDVEFYANYSFMHLRGGSNWYSMDKNSFSEKMQACFEGLQELLELKN